MTMLDRWAPWYSQQGPEARGRNYGPLTSYHAAETALVGLDVEDWGCGYGCFRTIHHGGYIGIDGTPGYCDVVADLTTYRSQTPGLLLRGVLDHNPQWASILVNALASFTERMVVILFTPNGDGQIIGHVPELDVYDYALPHGEIDRMITAAGCTFMSGEIDTASGYEGETIWDIVHD